MPERMCWCDCGLTHEEAVMELVWYQDLPVEWVREYMEDAEALRMGTP